MQQTLTKNVLLYNFNEKQQQQNIIKQMHTSASQVQLQELLLEKKHVGEIICSTEIKKKIWSKES